MFTANESTLNCQLKSFPHVRLGDNIDFNLQAENELTEKAELRATWWKNFSQLVGAKHGDYMSQHTPNGFRPILGHNCPLNIPSSNPFSAKLTITPNEHSDHVIPIQNTDLDPLTDAMATHHSCAHIEPISASHQLPTDPFAFRRHFAMEHFTSSINPNFPFLSAYWQILNQTRRHKLFDDSANTEPETYSSLKRGCNESVINNNLPFPQMTMNQSNAVQNILSGDWIKDLQPQSTRMSIDASRVAPFHLGLTKPCLPRSVPSSNCEDICATSKKLQKPSESFHKYEQDRQSPSFRPPQTPFITNFLNSVLQYKQAYCNSEHSSHTLLDVSSPKQAHRNTKCTANKNSKPLHTYLVQLGGGEYKLIEHLSVADFVTSALQPNALHAMSEWTKFSKCISEETKITELSWARLTETSDDQDNKIRMLFTVPTKRHRLSVGCGVQPTRKQISRMLWPNFSAKSFKHDRRLSLEATPEQPFYVNEFGWSSNDPKMTEQKWGLACRQLTTNDICLVIIQQSGPVSKRGKMKIEVPCDYSTKKMTDDQHSLKTAHCNPHLVEKGVFGTHHGVMLKRSGEHNLLCADGSIERNTRPDEVLPYEDAFYSKKMRYQPISHNTGRETAGASSKFSAVNLAQSSSVS
ncbi:Ataxin-1 and HBP1 module [Opisthorchis viverrini]|uniref:Ataxin-1 and HBP1 module n=1 Tax=Opisthorchis viverrini TaxID=6198 RepID=A0A1S8WIV3_OPIVI|nr:Ataxin-1 and HBP1 module [Opisthorchis viverrini]